MTPTVKPTQVGGLLPLPEPEIFEGNWETVECYTADQMHAYAQANVQALEARLVALEKDAARLDWLASEYVNLMPFDQPTGAGDADVGWRFSRFFQTRPFERVIHTHYNDNIREAIDAALLESAK